MKVTTLIEAIGRAVAGFPEGANRDNATVEVVRNGDLNYLAVFTDGDETHEGNIALNVVAVPLLSIPDDHLPGYVIDGVGKAAAEYRGKQREGLVP